MFYTVYVYCLGNLPAVLVSGILSRDILTICRSGGGGGGYSLIWPKQVCAAEQFHDVIFKKLLILCVKQNESGS